MDRQTHHTGPSGVEVSFIVQRPASSDRADCVGGSVSLGCASVLPCLPASRRLASPDLPSEPSEHVVPGVAEAIDESRYPLPPDPTGVVRVAPPGPGDDIGMMIVYSDGFVRFESVSGWTIWLTDQEQTYGWEC